MIASEILSRFEMYVDDNSELSSTEELALLNEKYHTLLADRTWNFNKTTTTSTQSTSVPYVSLAADFSFLLPNYNYTEMFASNDQGSAPVVVFVGTDYTPYRVINWSDRRQYRNQDGYAYVDYPNTRLYFTLQPASAKSIEYDYYKAVSDLTTSDSPAFPSEFHPIIYLDMALDDDIIQRYPKAESYLAENRAKRDEKYRQLAYWDSQFNFS